MKKITILNVGPISKVDINLKKVNVFMGPQSSGKSTIAKIISYCQWVEKRFLLDKEYNHKVSEQLLEFHRISEKSFSEKSLIRYETNFVTITYKGAKLIENIVSKDNVLNYKKTKNIYIPSERNFVSVIPNLSKYKETNDNIMSFLYDWYNAKRKFSLKNTLPILNLGVNFYNDPEKDIDTLIVNDSVEIQLREGSSGLQSVIPLILIIEYLTKNFYDENISKSVSEFDSINEVISKNILEVFSVNKVNKIIGKSKNKEEIKLTKKDLNNMANLFFKLTNYFKTNLIIEEPEQNLFPKTQRDLVYYILNRIQGERDHSLILTSHSPYILYAINNCLMGSTVKSKMPEEEQKELKSYKSWISSDEVSIWQLNKGEVHSVLDERTKTVTKHYFNEITNEIMDEYYDMLEYFEYAE